MNVRGHARVAEGSDQDCVEFASQPLEAVERNSGAIGEIAVGAPIERGQRERRAGGFEHLHGLRNDLFANAVAGDDGDLFGRAHGRKISENHVHKHAFVISREALAGRYYDGEIQPTSVTLRNFRLRVDHYLINSSRSCCFAANVLRLMAPGPGMRIADRKAR